MSERVQNKNGYLRTIAQMFLLRWPYSDERRVGNVVRIPVQGALSRLLALLISVWAWLQRQLSKLTHRSDGSSSSGAAAGA